MARPVTQRPTVRVGVSAPQQAPSLDVAAPLDVRTPAAPEGGLSRLLETLGIGAGLYNDRKELADKQELEAGQDAMRLGVVDQARAKRSKLYAEGAYQVAVLEQYQEAERRVAARTSTDELDKSRTLDEQVQIVDGWMRSELGPLVADERAKRLIGERYQQFIDTFAGQVMKAQAQANAEAAEEVAMQDISSQLERTGGFNWDEQFHRLYSQTGDATRANGVLVGIVAQAIENAATAGQDYEQLRALIPAEVIGPNGEKLPGPMYNPKYRGLINTAMARGEDLRDHFYRQQYAGAEYKARLKLDEDLAAGVPITEDSIAAYGFTVGVDPGDTMTPAMAAQYIQSSQLARVRKQEEVAEQDSYLESRAIYGSWANAIGTPGGPESKDKAQKAYDDWVQLTLTSQGAPIEALGGIGLFSDPSLVDGIANLSAQEGLPYTPLKHTMSSISQAAPGDVAARLDAYKVLKAKGVAGQYVDDDSALIYEVAIGAKEAGENAAGVAERIRTMGDKTTADYVASQMQKVKIRRTGYDIPTDDTRFLFFGVEAKSTQAMNAGYLATKYERLTAAALSKGLSLEEAENYAKERIRDTHYALNIQGRWAVLPRTAISDPRTTTEALDWYESVLPELAKRLKIPKEEPLQILPRFDINGRGLSFEVSRQGGVGTGVVFTAESLIETYRKYVPPVDPRQKAIERSKAIQRINKAPQTKPLPGSPQDLNPAHRAGRE